MMDERARRICEKAFDTLDRVKEQQAIWDAEREAETFDQRYAREAAEHDAYLAERERQRRERTKPEKPQPKVNAGMTDADRAWVQHRLDLLTQVIGQCVHEDDIKLLGHIRTQKAEIAALREEMGQLRAAVTLLEAHKASKSDVSPEGSLMSLRGRRVA